MSTMLLLNPYQLTAQVVETNNTVNFIQSSDVNLSEPGAGSSKSGSAAGSGSGMFLLLAMFLLLMLLFRPRRDKEGDKFRNSLQAGQEVITASGVFGKIVTIDEVSAILEIGKDMRIRVDKRYINPVPTPEPVKPAGEKKSWFGKKNKEEKAK